MNKKDKIVLLERAIEVFHYNDEPTPDDYMDLFVTVASVTSFGDGLMWVDVKEALEGIVDYGY